MIYRVHAVTGPGDSEPGRSLGYSFHPSQGAALRAMADHRLEGRRTTLDAAPTPKGKAAWLELLNEWGGHPGPGPGAP